MINYDCEHCLQENIDLYNEMYPPFEVCTYKDREVIHNIRNAIENLSLANYSFTTFSLGLSDLDYCVLDKLSIREYNTTTNYADLSSLIGDTTSFIKLLALDNENDIIANYVSKLTTRIISNIIDASDYSQAWSYIRSDVDPNGFGKYGEYNFLTDNDDAPDWHIDKSFEEMIYPNAIPTKDQLTFIFTLKGNSTLFHAANDEIQQTFLNSAIDLDIIYGTDRKFNTTAQNLFDISNAYSAKVGEGTVHVAGKAHGTIHTAPNHHERLVAIVVPETKENIKGYRHFIKKMNEKWMQEFIQDDK